MLSETGVLLSETGVLLSETGVLFDQVGALSLKRCRFWAALGLAWSNSALMLGLSSAFLARLEGC